MAINTWLGPGEELRRRGKPPMVVWNSKKTGFVWLETGGQRDMFSVFILLRSL